MHSLIPGHAQGRFNSFLKNLQSRAQLHIIGPVAGKTPPPEELVDEAVLYVDGGLGFQKELDRRGSFSIGDGDSLPASSPELDYVLPREKDQTDFEAALELVPLGGIKTVWLWGLHGGRNDHELGNLMACYQKLCGHRAPLHFRWGNLGEQLMTLLAPGKWECQWEGTFSAFLFTADTKFCLQGQINYPVPNPAREVKGLRPLSAHGVSNYATGLFTLEAETPVLLIFVWDQTRSKEEQRAPSLRCKEQVK